MRGGARPSLSAAAAEAKVSRATAYRYFPTTEAFLIEVASVSPAFEPVERMLEGAQADDAADRLKALLETFNTIAFTEEARMRLALKAYLDSWLSGQRNGKSIPRVRAGRRMRWLDRVLGHAAAHLSPDAHQRLKAALALTMGADAMVVMKDVCGLDDQNAREVLLWAAQTLLAAGLAVEA